MLSWRAKRPTEEFCTERGTITHRVEGAGLRVGVALRRLIVEREKKSLNQGHCTKGGKEKMNLRKILAFELTGFCD